MNTYFVRPLLAMIAFCLLTPAIVPALSLTEWQSLPTQAQRSAYVLRCAETLAGKMPGRRQAVIDWFTVTPAGRSRSDGLAAFQMKVLVLDSLARRGRADLSTLTVQDILTALIHDRFSPHRDP